MAIHERTRSKVRSPFGGSGCPSVSRWWWTGAVEEASGRWSRLTRWGSARLAGRIRVRGQPPSANRASSFHLLWDVPTSEPLIEASVSLTVPVLPRVSRLYFWALQVSFSGGAGAHLGLQWGADVPRGLRHVNWGGYGASGAELSGGISELPSSFDNPNTHDFDWEPGRPYRLRISRAAGGWAGWIDNTMIRCLDAPGETLQNPMVWSEVFADCDHPSVSVRWSGLELVTRSSRHVPVTSAVAMYQSRQDGGCDNTTSESEGHAFVQTTNVPRSTPRGARLRVD